MGHTNNDETKNRRANPHGKNNYHIKVISQIRKNEKKRANRRKQEMLKR